MGRGGLPETRAGSKKQPERLVLQLMERKKQPTEGAHNGECLLL